MLDVPTDFLCGIQSPWHGISNSTEIDKMDKIYYARKIDDAYPNGFFRKLSKSSSPVAMQ